MVSDKKLRILLMMSVLSDIFYFMKNYWLFFLSVLIAAYFSFSLQEKINQQNKKNLSSMIKSP